MLFWLLGSLASVQPVALAGAAAAAVVGLTVLIVVAPFTDALASGGDRTLLLLLPGTHGLERCRARK